MALLAVSIGDVRVAAATLPGLTIQGLAVDPVDARVIYAATSAGIYRSTDSGVAWSRVTPTLTYNYFMSIAIDPNDHCGIYAGVYANPRNANTNAIILRSLDCGATWAIPAGTFFGAVGVSVAVTATTPSTFYYSYYANGNPVGQHSIVRSVGGTSTSSFTFEDGTYVLAIDPADPCTILAGTIFGNVIRSTNCGPMSWSSVGGNLGSRVWGVAVHPSNHVTMLAATTGGLYRKGDAAAAWTLVMSISPSRVQTVSFESGNPLVAYAGGSNGIVYKSTDGGLTWNSSSTLSSGITALAAAPAPSAAMYAGGNAFITNVGPSGPLPTVMSIAPSSGAASGGTAVTITGTNFVSGATVAIGGVAATSIVVSNPTTITATTGAHAAGLVNVVVTNPDSQTGALTNGYTYVGPAPTVTAIAPPYGSTSGGTAVTITGTNFAPGATVAIGGAAATSVVVSNPTTITATTGARAAGLVNVVVTNPDTQTGILTNGFRYQPPFTADDPLIPGSSIVRAVNITELQTRINAVRVAHGLGAITWRTITTNVTTILAQDIADLRLALDQAYDQIPRARFSYTRSIVVGQTIQASDVEETRSALAAVE